MEGEGQASSSSTNPQETPFPTHLGSPRACSALTAAILGHKPSPHCPLREGPWQPSPPPSQGAGEEGELSARAAGRKFTGLSPDLGAIPYQNLLNLLELHCPHLESRNDHFHRLGIQCDSGTWMTT